MTGPMYEMGGQFIGKGLQGALAPRAGKVTPQGEQLTRTGQEAGFTPSPADVAPGGMIRRGEALAEKQFGGGRINVAAEKEIEAMRGSATTGKEGWLQRRARDVAGPSGQMDASRVARGETIQQGLEDIAQAHRVGEAVQWEFPKALQTGKPDFQIDNLREYMRSRLVERGDLEQAISPGTTSRLSSTGGRMVTSRGKAEVFDLGPESHPAFASAQTGEPVPLLEATGRRTVGEKPGIFRTERATRSGMTSEEMIAGLAQGEGPITGQQAIVLRKALGEMYERGDKGPLAAFRRDMEADAGFNPARAKAWEEARAYTKENIVPFRSDQPLGRLIDKGEPVAVVQELMAPRDARITLLRAIEKQTGKTGPVWDAVQAEAITQAIENPRLIKNIGPETRKVLFSKEQGQFLDQLQNWRETSTAAQKESKGLYARTGTNIVGYDQIRQGITLLIGAGASGGAAYMGHPGLGLAAGTTILVAPNVIARMLTNPTTAKWLAQGFTTPAGSPEAIRIASQVIPRYLSALGQERPGVQGTPGESGPRPPAQLQPTGPQ